MQIGCDASFLYAGWPSSFFIAVQAVKFYNYSIKKNYNAEPFKPFITEENIITENFEIDEFLNAKNNHNSEDSFGDSSDENFQLVAPEAPPELPPPLPKKPNKNQSMSAIGMPTNVVNQQGKNREAPEKPKLFPKPSVVLKPPRNTHKGTTDKGSVEVNDNNLDNHQYSNSKSTIIAKIPDFSPSTDNSNNNTFIEHENPSNDDEPILRPKQSQQRVTKTDEEVYIELKSICNLTDPLRKYSKTKEVGKGASGVVFIATDLESQKQVAIKTIDLKNQSSKELILNEIRVLIDFNHKNLVNFLEAYYLEESDTLWVVLEYMNGWVDDFSLPLSHFFYRCRRFSGPLTDVVTETVMNERQISAVCREVSERLHRQPDGVFPNEKLVF